MNKILYILEDGRFGGMNKMISDLATEIRKYNFEPFLIIGKKNSAFFTEKLIKQSLPHQTVPLKVLSKNINVLLSYSLFFIPDLIKLSKLIKTSNAEYVYCNGSQQIKGVIAASLLRKQVIWHIHDTYQPAALLTIFKIVKSLFGIRHFIASSDRTIVFYGLDRKKTHISIPPVNSREFSVTTKSNDKNQRKTILTVCNVNTDKGIETLIETVEKINRTRNDIDFKIIGLIPETQKLYFKNLLDLIEKRQIKNIFFLGQRDDIYQQLSDAFLYLCTSNNESGPISVFEAMSMGIPVVSTDVGDLKNIFDKYNCGTIQPVGDAEALAKEILLLLDNPDKMTTLSKNVRRAVVESIDISICAEKQAEYFYTLMKKS